MPQGPDFSPMDVGEQPICAIDFAKWLSPGVTITSIVSFTAVPSSIVTPVGLPVIGIASSYIGGSGVPGMAVIQIWKALAAGTALFTATIITSDGQTLSGWAHGTVQTPA